MLETRDLVKRYGKRCVVDGVSIGVGPGEIVGLLGPNGAGKTTTFRMTVGFIRPDTGAVYFDGKDVTREPMYRRARLGIGYLSQERSVFARLTVAQNVLAILETIHMTHRQRQARLAELLDELNLTRLAGNRAGLLSGGEQRRLEITRSLVMQPRIMMLDEPFAAIDPLAVQEIQEIIKRLAARGIGILLTDHKARETLQSTDRAYMIHEGRIFKEGTPAEIAGDPEVRKVYLGTEFRLDGKPQP